MTAVAVDDAWMEVCLIDIAKIGAATNLKAAGVTATLDFDIGEKDIEQIVLLNGGRVTKFIPEGMSSITFEAYPLQAGTDAGSEVVGFYDLMHTVDSTEPIRIINDRNRDRYRVLVLWTNDPTPTSANEITTDTYSALRIGMADGYFTSVKPSFTDGDLKFTITYKVAAFDKSAGGNVMIESCAGLNGSDILPAIANYTTTCKFD